MSKNRNLDTKIQNVKLLDFGIVILNSKITQCVRNIEKSTSQPRLYLCGFLWAFTKKWAVFARHYHAVINNHVGSLEKGGCPPF